MTTPAIIQLQEYATDDQHDISEVLRKALLVATKLKLSDFKEWLSKELNGYNSQTETKQSFPKYRVISGQLKAQNPYHGLVPFTITDSKIIEKVCTIHVRDSIFSLNELLAQTGTGETIAYHLSPDVEAILMRMQNSMAPLLPTRVVGTNQIISIINTVRTRILEWALALEEEGILGEGVTFRPKKKKLRRTV